MPESEPVMIAVFAMRPGYPERPRVSGRPGRPERGAGEGVGPERQTSQPFGGPPPDEVDSAAGPTPGRAHRPADGLLGRRPVPAGDHGRMSEPLRSVVERPNVSRATGPPSPRPNDRQGGWAPNRAHMAHLGAHPRRRHPGGLPLSRGRVVPQLKPGSTTRCAAPFPGAPGARLASFRQGGGPRPGRAAFLLQLAAGPTGPPGAPPR